MMAVGDADSVVGDALARRLFNEASTIPKARKTFILYRSDYHGFPPLIANHFTPTAASQKLDNGDGPFRRFQMNAAEVNALDKAGIWRMTDMALSAGFSGKTLMEVSENGRLLRHLGYWSDGKRVAQPLVGDDPTPFPRVLLPNGARIIDYPFSFLGKKRNLRNNDSAKDDKEVEDSAPAE